MWNCKHPTELLSLVSPVLPVVVLREALCFTLPYPRYLFGELIEIRYAGYFAYFQCRNHLLCMVSLWMF